MSGAKEDIYNHQLLVHSDKYACVDSDGLPTGKFNLVKDTPFDFNSMTRIGDVIDSDDEQLKLGAVMTIRSFLTKIKTKLYYIMKLLDVN